ncbi:hypothetical protein HMI56_001859 [Coelomomyces lativittatus]|nr:hypothetical protein HMI56_001859 [Coelomomyces lativittatus]
MSGHSNLRKFKFVQSDSEEETIQKYRHLQSTCFENKKSTIQTQEAFHLTTQLLFINPELYSIWNYRRTLFPFFSDLPTELK